mgnify:CR=1 FL=1
MNNKGKGGFTYGAGDGDMTPQKANMRAMAKGGGLKGYMDGGGVYDGLVEAQTGGDRSKQTAAEIQAYNSSAGKAPGMTSQQLKDNIKATMVQNRSENKATRQARRAATKANRAENKTLRQAKRAVNSNQRRGY